MHELNYYRIQTWRKLDGDNTPAIPVAFEDAKRFNSVSGGMWDIYWTMNEFSGFGKRKKEDLAAIRSFYVEVDGGQKEIMERRIRSSLTPSLIVESKNGYHIYWFLKEPIDCRSNPIGYADRFRQITVEHLLSYFGGDKQACDACRLLRVPFFRYWKDRGVSNFHADIVLDREDLRYTVDDIKKHFPKTEVSNKAPSPATSKPNAYKSPNPTRSNSGCDDSFWAKANNLDVVEGLRLLSGSSHVSGEQISFKPEGQGRTRILINGKKCNAWIDANGKIGSTDDGGPSIPNWLYYYHRDWKRVAAIVKEVFKL